MLKDLQEKNSGVDVDGLNPQSPSFFKRIEIWIGRLAMVSFMTTMAILVLNVDY